MACYCKAEIPLEHMKEAKAMKRQIEILQVCANVPARARLRVHLWRVGALVDALVDT